MFYLKITLVLAFAVLGSSACLTGGAQKKYVIAESKAYEASLFRQNCAICHGPEGDGKKLMDGTVVPSLRAGEFKAKTPDAIFKQIADGGNGMLPFRRSLSDREMRMLTEFVHRDLRGGQ